MVYIKTDRRLALKLTAILMAVIIFTGILPINVYAESMTAEKMQLVVNGGESRVIRALNVSYENDVYLSLSDIKRALEDTEKSFYTLREGAKLSIYTEPAEMFETEAVETEADDGEAAERERELLEAIDSWGTTEYGAVAGAAVAAGDLSVNNNEVRYYYVSIGGENFFTPYDIGLILNVEIESAGENRFVINTERPFGIDPEQLELKDYFFGVNSVLVGDASTGEIFYAYNGKNSYAIASTTKLMTYLVIMDAVKAGEMTLGDIVRIPPEAAKLSKNGDMVLPLKEGDTAAALDLLNALLIPSSNECALTLAIHLCGSEEAFVERMNEKARELQMDTAVFYNCNGLPVFTADTPAAKRQNNMSSEDMFKLSSHILNTYPEITEITSKKKETLASFGNKEIKNTNMLLYNMPEATGLKTGTTTRSGACLVSSFKVNDGKLSHDLVVVLLGAEDGKSRIRVSQLMAAYGKAVIQGVQPASGGTEAEEEKTRPVTAAALVNYVVNYARHSK